jgi:hypothetical protein
LWTPTIGDYMSLRPWEMWDLTPLEVESMKWYAEERAKAPPTPGL